MVDAYAFDESSAQRIMRAVRTVEGQARGGPAESNLRLGALAESGLIPFIGTDLVPAGAVFVDNGGTEWTDGILTLAARQTQITGERPIYVNLLEEVAIGDVGFCRRPDNLGPIKVAYDDTDGTPAAGETWGPVKTNYRLRKGLPGFKILLAGDSGLVWAVYDEVGEPSMYGKIDASPGALSPGGSCTVSLYWLSGGTWTDTTFNETAYAPPTFTTGTIASAKWVRVKWIGQSRRLEVVNAEC